MQKLFFFMKVQNWIKFNLYKITKCLIRHLFPSLSLSCFNRINLNLNWKYSSNLSWVKMSKSWLWRLKDSTFLRLEQLWKNGIKNFCLPSFFFSFLPSFLSSPFPYFVFPSFLSSSFFLPFFLLVAFGEHLDVISTVNIVRSNPI